MKRISKGRGARQAGLHRWPPPHFATDTATPNPLREGGTLRVHASHAALEALIRHHLPPQLRSAAASDRAILVPIPRAGSRPNDGAQAATNGRSAATDGTPPGGPGNALLHAAPAAPAPAGALVAAQGPAAAPWRDVQSAHDAAVHALFRIF